MEVSALCCVEVSTLVLSGGEYSVLCGGEYSRAEYLLTMACLGRLLSAILTVLIMNTQWLYREREEKHKREGGEAQERGRRSTRGH